MKHYILYLLVSFSFCTAQNRTVKFKILDKKNIPMPAVNIVLKNSNPVIGTQTDFHGNAELQIPKDISTIVLSYLGPNEPHLEITQTTDSILINLSRRKAIYYSGKKRVKKVCFK